MTHVLLVMNVPAADKLPVKLLQEAVLLHVDLVAKGPREDGRVLAVLDHLALEALRHLEPVLRAADRGGRGVAQRQGDQHAQAVVDAILQKEPVVCVLVPAIDANGVGTHGLEQRKVPAPEKGILVREVVAVGTEEHRLINGRGRIAHAPHVVRLSIHQYLTSIDHRYVVVIRP